MRIFRHARPGWTVWNVTKTLVVLLAFWYVFLILIPLQIARVEHADEMTAFFVPVQELAGIIVGALAILIAVWAALTIAIDGYGTPLPFDAVRKYVVTGPYAYVRNPILVAVVVQCLADSLYTGSILILPAGIFVAFIWSVLVYPMEKREYERAFGREYEAHRRSVPLWVPQLSRWTPPPGTRPISLEDIPQPRDRRRTPR